MKLKPFRFAWNGQILSKEDTYWILGTILIITATLFGVILALLIERGLR